MAKNIETEISKKEIVTVVLEKLNISEFNSIRIWEGDREISLDDLKVVIYQDDDKASIPLSDEENKQVLSNVYRTKDNLAFNIASTEENIEEFRINGNELLTVMHNAITKDIVKMAVEYEYNEDEGILGQITDALYVVRKHMENEYGFPESKLVNLGLCDAVYEFVRFQGIKHFNVDIAEKQTTGIYEDIQNFADEANKILEGTPLKVVIIETSELYGENDDEVSKDNPFYMKPMYEAYIEDSDEEEICNTRTGRYCSLEDVSDELKSFCVENAKLYYKEYTIISKKNSILEEKFAEIIEQIRKDVYAEDYTAIFELLRDVSESELLSYIGDETYLEKKYSNSAPYQKIGMSKEKYIKILKEINEWEVTYCREKDESIDDLPETIYPEIARLMEDDGYDTKDVVLVMHNRKGGDLRKFEKIS